MIKTHTHIQMDDEDDEDDDDDDDDEEEEEGGGWWWRPFLIGNTCLGLTQKHYFRGTKSLYVLAS